MKRSLCFLALLCPLWALCQDTTIRGVVLDEESAPVSAATLRSRHYGHSVTADAHGAFHLSTRPGDTLVISAAGFDTQEVPVKHPAVLTITLIRKSTSLSEVTVNTGYQRLPRERATGSFDVVGNRVLSRRAGTGLLEHIENTTPGLFINRADNQQPNTLSIRGRSTILANAQPLIILDNFPYDGDLSSINPGDIESVTVLKDAAAASIWGARAGNGVLVITTKSGHTVKPQVAFSSSLTLTERPDLFNLPVIGSAEYIELEKFLYTKGYYKSTASSSAHLPLTPVVDLLLARDAGTVPVAEADAQMEAFKAFDARRDISNYLYQTGAVQQYNVALSGQTPLHQYYFSAGYDHTRANLVGSTNDRFSVRSTGTFKLHKRLDLQAGLSLTRRGSGSGSNSGEGLSNGAGKGLYPYARLTDDAAQPAVLVRDYRASFVAGAPTAGLLDWTFIPLQEIQRTTVSGGTMDYLLTTGLVYRMARHLTAEGRYQYEGAQGFSQQLYGEDSYFARNLVNRYTQVSPTGVLTRPIPIGGILQRSDRELHSHQVRAQLGYRPTWGHHQLSALAGVEVKDLGSITRSYTQYGYNSTASAVVDNLDYSTRYRRYDNPSLTATIPNNQGLGGTTDRFVSYYTNWGYSFKNRYHLSVSARKDASNLFGVRTNQRTVPLWSVGVRWDAHREKFYPLDFLSRLSLRGTWGYSGNIARNTSAFTTASYSLSQETGLVMAMINNPPNEALRWEKNRTFNLGLDFTLKGERLSGSLEWFRKRATDLMGRAPIDPTVGLANYGGSSSFYGNIAAMKGGGWDLQLEGRPLTGRLVWTSTLNFSHVFDRVTDYAMPVAALGNAYLGESFVTPVIGRPLFSVFSFKWGGLNASGDPTGYLDGKRSTDVSSIVNKTPLDSLHFHGSINPELFGAWRNALSFKGLTLSWVASYRGRYAFRRHSISYSQLFGTWTGHGDYARRWQKAGDEYLTAVPALAYPANANRDRFYNYSEVLVERGDHLRLEDVSLGWEGGRDRLKWLPFQQVQVSVVASGWGVLWVANSAALDPNYTSGLRPGRSLALILNFQL